jgi:hypothetical protein
MRKNQGLRRPYKITRKRKILKSKFFWFSLAALLAGSGIFYWLIFSSFFQIREIKVYGAEKVSVEDIRGLAEKKISRKILFFSTKSIFSADLNEISAAILKEFPRLAQVSIKRSFPDSLLLRAIERKPIGTYCWNQECFFLDKEGVIFEEALSGKKMPIFRIEARNSKAVLGEKILEKEKMTAALKIIQNLEEGLKIEPTELIFSPAKLTLKTSEGWNIYFDPAGDIDWQIIKLNVVLEKKIPPEKRKNLEYIELRFGDRAYLK